MLDQAFDGQAGSLAEVRAAVAQAGEGAGLDREWTEKAKLVANELAANALEAAPNVPYRVRVESQGHDFTITVSSRSDESDLPPRDDWGPSQLLAQRGRGLAIVETLADRVDVSQNGDEWLEISARLVPSPAN